MSSITKQPTPLPKLLMAGPICIQLCEAVNVTILFPFLAFMIEDLGYGGHLLGYYAGGLAAAFCGGQFISSVAWGKISDIYGRRFAIVCGTFGTAIGMLIFGTAKTYWQAILGRFVGGVLCGNVGVMKSYLTEITDDTNRGSGFTAIAVAFASGQFLAPLAGGLLCSPAEKYPNYFSEDGLFGEFPYLLPCLLAFAMNLFTAAFCFFVMKPGIRRSTSSASIEMTSLKKISNIDNGEKYSLTSNTDDAPPGQFTIEGDSDEEVEFSMPPTGTKETMVITDEEVAMVVEEEEWLEGSETCWSWETWRGLFVSSPDESYSRLDGRSDHGDTETLVQHDPSAKSSVQNSSSRRVAAPPLLQKIVTLATGSYGMLAMGYIVYEETVPLFLKLSKEEGGFALSSSQIGILLSLSGAVMLLFCLLVLPKFANASKKNMFRVGFYTGLPSILAWPISSYINTYTIQEMDNRVLSTVFLWTLLLILMVMKSVCGQMQFTAVMIQVNHSVTDDHLGAVNGLGQSLAALARAVGPALGGMLWSISIRKNFIFLNFLGVIIMLYISYWMNIRLPNSIDGKRGGGSVKEAENDSGASLSMAH